MNALNRQARKEGRKAMEAELTPAKRIYRRLQQGPKVQADEPLDAIPGFRAACSLRDRLMDAVRAEELPAEDAVAAVIFEVPNVGVRTAKILPGRDAEESLLTEMISAKGKVYGVLYAIRDRVKPQHYLWAHQLVKGELATALLVTALDLQAKPKLLD